jgi:hypothetical protein
MSWHFKRKTVNLLINLKHLLPVPLLSIFTGMLKILLGKSGNLNVTTWKSTLEILDKTS